MPNKNGLYGIKVGVHMPYLGALVCHIFGEIRLQKGEGIIIFMLYEPSFYGILWGQIFCIFGGWGLSNWFSLLTSYREYSS